MAKSAWSPYLKCGGCALSEMVGKSAGALSWWPHRPTLVPLSTTLTPFAAANLRAMFLAAIWVVVNIENTLTPCELRRALNRATYCAVVGAHKHILASLGSATLCTPFNTAAFSPRTNFSYYFQPCYFSAKDHFP